MCVSSVYLCTVVFTYVVFVNLYMAYSYLYLLLSVLLFGGVFETGFLCAYYFFATGFLMQTHNLARIAGL